MGRQARLQRRSARDYSKARRARASCRRDLTGPEVHAVLQEIRRVDGPRVQSPLAMLDKRRPPPRLVCGVAIDGPGTGAYSVEEAQAAPEPTQERPQVPNRFLPQNPAHTVDHIV